MTRLYSFRQQSSLPRDLEEIQEPAWISIKEVVRQCLNANYLAQTCPRYCDECLSVTATDEDSFFSLITREIPRLDHRRFEVPGPLPRTWDILDLIELAFSCVAMPTRKQNAECYYECEYMEFSKSEGQIKFRELINDILSRERIAVELAESGLITRVGAPILSDIVRDIEFKTGDETLDSMLETAQTKFVNRDSAMHREALLELWQSWERLKSLKVPGDKKVSIRLLLDGVTTGPIRERLETEANELTDIGNKFAIRHSEKDRHPLDDDSHVDYLFHRLFSLVYLILDATGRVGR